MSFRRGWSVLLRAKCRFEVLALFEIEIEHLLPHLLHDLVQLCRISCDAILGFSKRVGELSLPLRVE